MDLILNLNSYNPGLFIVKEDPKDRRIGHVAVRYLLNTVCVFEVVLNLPYHR